MISHWRHFLPWQASHDVIRASIPQTIADICRQPAAKTMADWRHHPLSAIVFTGRYSGWKEVYLTYVSQLY